MKRMLDRNIRKRTGTMYLSSLMVQADKERI